MTIEPARVAVGADRLRRLEGVLDLTEVDVGVAVVDQRLDELERLPDRHAPPVERQVPALLGAHEVERLVQVVEPVELVDRRARALAVVAKAVGVRGCAHGRPDSIERTTGAVGQEPALGAERIHAIASRSRRQSSSRLSLNLWSAASISQSRFGSRAAVRIDVISATGTNSS